MAKKLFTGKVILSRSFFVACFVFFLFSFFTHLVFASEINGTIDGNRKYAWGENIGWINFGCANCKVLITDNNVSGYAWSKHYGWINLNPSTSGVKNNGEGILSGFAWSSNLGWINFSGVTIASDGVFWGYATIKSDNSRINFNCSNENSCALASFDVRTDWRPANLRNNGGGHSPPIIPPILPPVLPPVVTPPIITPPVTPPPTLPQIITKPIVSFVDGFSAIFKSTTDFVLSFFRPKNKPAKNIAIIQIPKNAPLSLNIRWNLLPVKAIREFVFAPLPYEVRILASKFPELNNTLNNVGIKRLTDMSRLNGVTLNLPGLSELTNTLKNVGTGRLADVNKLNGVTLSVPELSNINPINGKLTTNLGAGKISLIKGLPLSKFSLADKKNLPSEFVFARADKELVDLNVAMSIGDKGQVNQQISSLPGQTLRLVVKPISKARSVTGYFVFKSATPRITQNTQTEISRSSLTASALFAMNDLVESVPTPIPVENKLVLSSFEYTDPDHDGIYTADVASPVVPGEYEVITIIDYIDPVLGSRRMSMIAVIDPEGYIFEKNSGKETRIPSAIVSLYYLNTVTKKYELWPAKDYSQDNPQVTDIRGTYSFLVPEGSYYFEVEAPGYAPYNGKTFVVVEGSGIHQNIELRSDQKFLSNFDWKTVLLFVVLLLLMYNLYRNSERDKLLKSLNKNDGK